MRSFSFSRRSALTAALWMLSGFATLWPSHARAQGGGSVDPVFGGAGLGLLYKVRGVFLQADGKVLVAGGNRGFARLNADSTPDLSFQTSFTGYYAAALQTDGKIIVSSESNYDLSAGVYRDFSLVRLNTDGSVDTGFQATINNFVSAIAVQADGRIVVAGGFTQIDGVTRNRVARLNADGSLDTSYDVGSGPEADAPAVGDIRQIILDANGKVVLGGEFLRFNGVARKLFARLNTDGSLDASFDPGDAIPFASVSLLGLSDGRLLVGGAEVTIGDSEVYFLVRRNANGSLDSSFQVTGDDVINPVLVQPDGKIIVGGGFTKINGVAHNHIARLNADGTLDASFTAGADDSVLSGAIQADGKLVVSGFFSQVNGALRNSVARLNTDYSIDTGYTPDVSPGPNGAIDTMTLQADGKVLISGFFTQVNGTAHGNIARLKTDATPDAGFNASLDSRANGIALQPNGQIVVAGFFKQVNGAAHTRIARLNADGSLDTGFNASIGTNTSPNAVALQDTGKIVVGGNFDHVNGIARDSLARLNADGSLDTGFTTVLSGGPFSLNWVFVIVVQPDGKILLGGQFRKVNGAAHQYMARLNADGSVDSSFNVTANGYVRSISFQGDGKILIGGYFTTINGTAHQYLARLNTDGSVDETFNGNVTSQNTTNYQPYMVQQPNGKIIVGGDFSQINGVPRSYLAHLNEDGSLDPFFNLDSGMDGTINALVTQPDGKVLVGGNFSTMNKVLRNYAARLKADGKPDFFADQVSVGGGFYYMKFASGNPFGYYNVAGDGYSFPFLYHDDLGMEYFFDAQDGQGGAYLYDFASSTFFYTNPGFPWPYMYDFSLNSVVYYYPDPTRPDHYNTNGYRFFYVFNTGQIISK